MLRRGLLQSRNLTVSAAAANQQILGREGANGKLNNDNIGLVILFSTTTW